VRTTTSIFFYNVKAAERNERNRGFTGAELKQHVRHRHFRMCFGADSMKKPAVSFRVNALLARKTWGEISKTAMRGLKELTSTHSLSVAAGDLQILDGKWYVTHSGLLRIAQRGRCMGINTVLLKQLSNPEGDRWVFRATVYKRSSPRGFVGYGDADPSNVSPIVRGAEMRVAETRAVNRALRKAYGIGLCSVEELGWASLPPQSQASSSNSSGFHSSNGSNGGNRSNGSNGSPSRLRDKLCLLIRQYNLDPILVKEYAAHFCGTETIKDASRDLVESFIAHLASSAKEDIDGLICKLNSFSRPVEVKQ
jgi:hypothetical protein